MEANFLERTSKFMHTHAGLEKTLRLLQAVLQIGAVLEGGADDELAGRLWRTKDDISVGEFEFWDPRCTLATS